MDVEGRKMEAEKIEREALQAERFFEGLEKESREVEERVRGVDLEGGS